MEISHRRPLNCVSVLINLASNRTSRSLITLQDRRAAEAAVQQGGVFDRLDRGADDRHRRRGPYRQHRVITLSLSLLLLLDANRGTKSARNVFQA